MKFMKLTKRKLIALAVIVAVSVILSVIILNALLPSLSSDSDDKPGDAVITEQGHYVGEPYGTPVKFDITAKDGVSFTQEPTLQWGYNSDDSSGTLFITGRIESERDITACDMQFALLNIIDGQVGGGMTGVFDMAAGVSVPFVCELPLTSGRYEDIRTVALTSLHVTV